MGYKNWHGGNRVTDYSFVAISFLLMGFGAGVALGYILWGKNKIK